MARDRDENKDWSSQNDATMRKMERHYADVEAAAEAMERKVREVTSSVLKKDKKSKNAISQEFLRRYRGDEKPDPDLINFLRNTGGGSHGGVNSDQYEPDPTGFAESSGDLPWDEDY